MKGNERKIVDIFIFHQFDSPDNLSIIREIFSSILLSLFRVQDDIEHKIPPIRLPSTANNDEQSTYTNNNPQNPIILNGLLDILFCRPLKLGDELASGNKMNHGVGRKLRKSYFIVESVSIWKKNRTSELFGQVEILSMVGRWNRKGVAFDSLFSWTPM